MLLPCRRPPAVAQSPREKIAASLVRGPWRPRHGDGTCRHPGRHGAGVCQIRHGEHGGNGGRLRRHALPSPLPRLRKALPGHGRLPAQVFPAPFRRSRAGERAGPYRAQSHSARSVAADKRSAHPAPIATSQRLNRAISAPGVRSFQMEALGLPLGNVNLALN